MDLDVDLLHSADSGPIDGSILVLQQQHRSKKVWDADRTRPDDCESMRIRQVESRIHKRKQPSPAVMDLIRRARLEGLCSVPFLSLDWALITALVERWRPETHTFHMRPGELTITLQDIEILLGIPVDGRPVTGTTLIDPDDLCLRLLGEAPGKHDKKGGKVKLKWLRDRFNGIVEDGATAEVVARQARGYLLLLLGGTIFADFTGGCVHLSYLQLLENFDVAGEYSWGSGALSVLYRNLCHGAKIKSKQMTGPFILVQVWAWERFPYLAPGRRGKRAPQPGAPLLGRWDDDFHSPDLATHVVGAY
ncbi:serine/threonine-protein phosphatase 7 long form homolog [Rhododendron vialii]|uniref:serine/threonine-protein phosphatase 7 long form homolog n=1 Tax=Rhododendron vialii TaxID=182163 RepID=UPI00265FBC91|nr:serine/threonine-protein phosphatase 7 long form homolog [Rhododendron vialii]